MAKRRSGYVYVSVDVDVNDVIDEIDDEMLMQEVEDRKLQLGFDPMDDLRHVHEELLRGRPAAALAILERLIRPKWQSTTACETELKRASKNE